MEPNYQSNIINAKQLKEADPLPSFRDGANWFNSNPFVIPFAKMSVLANKIFQVLARASLKYCLYFLRRPMKETHTVARGDIQSFCSHLTPTVMKPPFRRSGQRDTNNALLLSWSCVKADEKRNISQLFKSFAKGIL